MEVGFYGQGEGRILHDSKQRFLLVELMGNAFLLTKVPPHSPVEKNVNFEVPWGSFYSTLSRNINLIYPRKLSQLLEHLSIAQNLELQHEWFALYEVHNFYRPPTMSLMVRPPCYGDSVLVQAKTATTHPALVSNLFKYSGEAFYFIGQNSGKLQEFSIITDEASSSVYGIACPIKDIVLCLPFHEILSERPCPVSLSPSIKPILESTCYINYRGSYCTGFLNGHNSIISARHVIPFEDQKIGLNLGVRFYPYHEERPGFIKRIGQGSVDIIQIALSHQVLAKKETAQVEMCKSSNIETQSIEALVGQEVRTLGFGKFAFSNRVFQKIELVMPTIEAGVVSKVINVGHRSIFLKTDAALYNGFSGCAVWLGNQIIGMAIFILKNKNNQSNFNRHNFSYTIQFIRNLLERDTQEQLISEINPELECFDRIQTRHKIPLMPRL